MARLLERRFPGRIFLREGECMHLFRYLAKIASIGIQKFVINRKNLAVVVLFEILDAIASIVFIEVIYGNFDAVAGYSKYELYFLYGINLCSLKIMMMFFIGGIDSFSTKVISRDVDFVLLKPMSPRVLMMCPDINIHQILSMTPSVCMVVIGVAHCDVAPGMNILFAAIGFVLGTALMMNIFSILMPIAFWTVGATGLNDFVFTLQSNSNYPQGIYPRRVRFALTFVFPIVLFSNPSVMCLFQKDSWLKYLVLCAVYVILTECIKRIVWRKGIERYKMSME